MTTPLLALLLVVVLLGVVFNATRRLQQTNVRAGMDPLRAIAALSPPETYRPISRLFTANDLAFVAKRSRNGQLQSRLRYTRSRVMRLYLSQIQDDFNNLWQVARYVAPYSTNPDFAALLTRQFCAFYLLLAAARLRGMFGWRLPIPAQVAGLVAAMEQLRTGVVSTVASLDTATPRTALTRG